VLNSCLLAFEPAFLKSDSSAESALSQGLPGRFLPSVDPQQGFGLRSDGLHDPAKDPAGFIPVQAVP
jgi:hypothetical protein